MKIEELDLTKTSGVIRDDGLYKQIRFARVQHSSSAFSLGSKSATSTQNRKLLRRDRRTAGPSIRRLVRGH